MFVGFNCREHGLLPVHFLYANSTIAELCFANGCYAFKSTKVSMQKAHGNSGFLLYTKVLLPDYYFLTSMYIDALLYGLGYALAV